MPEFNANEDPPRLNGLGDDEPFEVPKLRLRFMPRTRELASENCFRARRRWTTGPQATLATRQGRCTHRACAPAPARRLTAGASRRCRRLSAPCRGRGSGSQS